MLPNYHFGAWQDKTVPIFSVKSDWEPTEYIFPLLQKYFRHVLKDITDLYQQPTTNKVNLSQDEIKAVRELNQRQNKIYMISWYIQTSSPQPTTYQKHISNNEQF